MVRIHDVAAHILRERGPMTAMKLQKLCYYSYGYHLAWEERQLFPERFQAWANGPVSPDLYACHRGRFQLNPGEIAGDPEALDPGERESVDLVLQGLGDYTAHQLSTMTHAEGPWIKARERADVAPLERSKEPLRDEEIFEFFDALTSTANGQQAIVS
ncbi:MAG TPA: type II toxin-antitoxin system antitoxin SocA domain-containing protein [Streptosporangiaceae bacterium]